MMEVNISRGLYRSMQEVLISLMEQYDRGMKYSYDYFYKKGSITCSYEELNITQKLRIKRSSNVIKEILNIKVYDIEIYNLMEIDFAEYYRMEDIKGLYSYITQLLREGKPFSKKSPNLEVELFRGENFEESKTWIPKKEELQQQQQQRPAKSSVSPGRIVVKETKKNTSDIYLSKFTLFPLPRKEREKLESLIKL